MPNKTISSRLTEAGVRAFRKKVYDCCNKEGRDFPWRKRLTPYRVVVSEIMLHQTQVARVKEKYGEFLAAFPDFPALAKAPLSKLLRVWSGMGYNRRALLLRSLAQRVMEKHRGRLPRDPEKLMALRGVGRYTAGAVLAFAFNKPAVFMDTNIRRVYIHEFFHDREKVHDSQLIPLVERTMDAAAPRKWFNALMDYGAMLKRGGANPNRKSAHYTRQAAFENSNRQVRGRIVKVLVEESPLTIDGIVRKTGMDEERVREQIAKLTQEGFIRKQGRSFAIR